MLSKRFRRLHESPDRGEKDKSDYFFVSEEKFNEMLLDNKFIEYITYDNHLYGTLKDELERAISSKDMYVLIVEVNGALKIKELFPDAVTVFIAPPSLDELKVRLLKCGVNTTEEIETRLLIAESEINQRFKYDYCIVNDNIEEAVETLKNIMIKNPKILKN